MICMQADVFADESASSASVSIVTEYYSDDLTEPLGTAVMTASTAADLSVPAKSCILMETSTGEVLYESHSHDRLAPASITKIMTLLLTAEAMDSGQFSADTVLTASDHACSMGGSQIWLEPGEQMTVDDLLKATVVGSANDAAVVLAEAVSGSEEGFVALMNERAKELGLEDTFFCNATGLDEDGHLTSAYDIAVMSRELMKHEFIKKYTTIWMDTLRGGKSELVNTNKLVRFYDGCTGLKTGTTSVAGACLSATAERDGLSLVAVIMGAPNSTERFSGARKLLDYGFARYAFVDIEADEDTLLSVKVKNGVKGTVGAECTAHKGIIVEKSKAGKVSVDAEMQSFVKAPVKAGDRIGVLHIYADGEEIGVMNVTAAENVAKMTFGAALRRLIANCFSA